ncbi:hypothetical protein C8Q76DRAFT_798599 [Earliella scabrosa]|nr:hypothetical protein C8Q76DRAFT_798599 [Earliella scabrosa]
MPDDIAQLPFVVQNMLTAQADENGAEGDPGQDITWEVVKEAGDDTQHACPDPSRAMLEVEPMYRHLCTQHASMEHVEDSIRFWYGLHPITQRFNDVDYEACKKHLHVTFGQTLDSMPTGAEEQASLAAWACMAISGGTAHKAMELMWDLIPMSRHYILCKNDIRRHVRVAEWYANDDYHQHRPYIYELNFNVLLPSNLSGDAWVLLCSATAVVFLLRHLSIRGGDDASALLIQHGIPFRTAVKRSINDTSNAPRLKSTPTASIRFPF